MQEGSASFLKNIIRPPARPSNKSRFLSSAGRGEAVFLHTCEPVLSLIALRPDLASSRRSPFRREAISRRGEGARIGGRAGFDFRYFRAPCLRGVGPPGQSWTSPLKPSHALRLHRVAVREAAERFRSANRGSSAQGRTETMRKGAISSPVLTPCREPPCSWSRPSLRTCLAFP